MSASMSLTLKDGRTVLQIEQMEIETKTEAKSGGGDDREVGGGSAGQEGPQPSQAEIFPPDRDKQTKPQPKPKTKR